MFVNDIIKAGTGVSTDGSIVAGGLGVDPTNKKVYSSTDGTDVVDMTADLPDTVVGTEQESGVGGLVLNIIKVTQAEYDLLTPVGTTMYLIIG